MSAFPGNTELSLENFNSSADTPQSARAVLKLMAEHINAIIASYGQPNGICDLGSQSRIPTSRLQNIIDTAQIVSDAIKKKHFADDSVHAQHIVNDTIAYTDLNTADGIGQRAVTTTQNKLKVFETGVTSNSTSIKTFIDSVIALNLSTLQVTSWSDAKLGLNLPNDTSVMVGVQLKHNTTGSSYASREIRLYYRETL